MFAESQYYKTEKIDPFSKAVILLRRDFGRSKKLGRDGETDLTRAIKNIQAERFNKSAAGSQRYGAESKAEYIAKKDRDLINMPNSQGETPLMIAYLRYDYNKNLTAYLLRKGADVNAQDHKGQTLLTQMVSRGYYKSSGVKFLLSVGADPTIKDQDGKSALDYGQENLASVCHQKSNPRCADAQDALQMLENTAQKPSSDSIFQHKNH